MSLREEALKLADDVDEYDYDDAVDARADG